MGRLWHEPTSLGFKEFQKQLSRSFLLFFYLPLVSQTFSCLAELPWLPLHRLTRRLECVWRRRRSCKQMKAQWAIPGFCQSAPSSLPCVHKIPLSANLRSSIKRLENFKYQTFCLEVKFQSFDCIWGVCIEKKCHGKGQTMCRVSLEDEQKAEGTHSSLQKRSHWTKRRLELLLHGRFAVWVSGSWVLSHRSLLSWPLVLTG